MDRGHQGDTETEILKFLSHTINVLGAVKTGKSGGKSKIFGFLGFAKVRKVARYRVIAHWNQLYGPFT